MSMIGPTSTDATAASWRPELMTEVRPTISIFGLGYVGAVSAACFSDLGHAVIGVDLDLRKVAYLNNGRSPIVEAGLSSLLRQAKDNMLLRATTDVRDAVMSSDISFLSIGTPSKEDGGCDTTYLRQATTQIADVLRDKNEYHLVMYRSTVPPGTTRSEMIPILEEVSGKICGRDFGVCFNPEFLRESTAIKDFHHPPKTVIGTFDNRAGKLAVSLYDQAVSGEVIMTSLEVAEFVKYVDNTWHALKVTFGNEVGRICKAAGVDSHDVMDIFVKDKKLNLSPYYLMPGFAYGGSCLPKDTRGINHLAETLGVDVPVLSNIASSNDSHIEHAVELIAQQGKKRVGILGVTFKAGTDDLRESPSIELMSRLQKLGYEVRVYDPNLVSKPMHDSDNTQVLSSQTASDLADIQCQSLADLLMVSDVIVVANTDPSFAAVLDDIPDAMPVVDMVRCVGRSDQPAAYHGICW